MAFIKRRRVQSACSISLREMLSLSSLSTPWVARKLYTNIANFSPQQVLLSHAVSWQRALGVHS
jgi:predicted DNA-binding transcriptional regulator AlpA